LRKALRGLSYIGIIEPALYVNIAPGTRWSGKRALSWHVHAICWGENRKQMRKRFARLNKQGIYRSIMLGQRGAHQKEIPRKFLTDSNRTFFADKIRYMLKSPCKRTGSTMPRMAARTKTGSPFGKSKATCVQVITSICFPCSRISTSISLRLEEGRAPMC
jgi:hypothetical protein